MNDLELAITATLRADAMEAATATDSTRERAILENRLDRLDNRHRWRVLAATVAAAVAAAVVLGFLVASRGATNPDPPVTSASPSSTATPPLHTETSFLTPNVTVDLPYWTALDTSDGQGVGYAVYDQFDCRADPCPSDKQLKIGLMTVRQMYRPQDGSTMTKGPSFSVYTDAWLSLMARGAATITDKISTTVGGRPAVVMTAIFTRDVLGLAMCPHVTDTRIDCFYPLRDRTYRLAIVDQGEGEPPTLLYESMNSDNPSPGAVLAEFDTWLASVRFV